MKISKDFLRTVPAVLIAVMVWSCPKPAENSGEVKTVIPEDLMGMVHAGYTGTYADGSSGHLAEEYTRLDEMGVVWMLRDFSWSSIEPSDDSWQWDTFDQYVANANSHNKKIMGLLAYDVAWLHGGWSSEYAEMTDSVSGGKVSVQKYADGCTDNSVKGDAEIAEYCEYAAAAVTRYNGKNGHGKVDAWCIWNEPNLLPRFWTATPEDFFRLTKAAAAAIRQADPDAVIIGGALNTTADNNIWSRGIFNSGAMKQVDAVAYHPYTPNARGSYEIYNEFKEAVSSYGFGNKIWITEIGYPMKGSYGTEVAEEKMPLEVLKTITLLAAGGAQRIFWYELFDHGSGGNPSDSEHWFGLLNRDDFSRKGGADAYQLCALNFPGKTLRSALPERSGVSGDVAAYYFEGPDGKHTLVIWSNRLSRPQPVTVTLPGSNQKEWNIRTGISAPAGERSQWTLQKEAAGEQDFTQLRFFTWENSDRSKSPRISAN